MVTTTKSTLKLEFELILVDMFVGIFEQEEESIRRQLESSFRGELELFNKLLKVYERHLDATSSKVRDTDFPNWTILILLAQTLPLMNNAVELLVKGYLRSSETLIRVCAEAIILSIYFKEFPETEREFLSMNYHDFFHKHKIGEMLKRVASSGKFFKPRNAEKIKAYQSLVFEDLYKEASRFLHTNIGVIYDLSKNHQPGRDEVELIKGPQIYSREINRVALRRLYNAVLFSLLALTISLNLTPDDEEFKIIRESIMVSQGLNVGTVKSVEI